MKLKRYEKKRHQYLLNNNKWCIYLRVITSIILTEKFKNVGKALLPTCASASTFKCSKWTSIVGIAIPTLRNPKQKKKKKYPLLKIHETYIKSK